MYHVAGTTRKPLYLAEDEAMALLEMCLLTRADDDDLHAEALLRVSDFCRRFLQPEDRPAPHRGWQQALRFLPEEWRVLAPAA